jgi:hypothetical protein
MSFIFFRFFFKRPSAKELLRHRFIKGAKRTSYLIELIERFREWKARGGNRNTHSGSSSSSDEDDADKNGTIGGGWVFPTVRNPNTSNHKRTSSGGALLNPSTSSNVKNSMGQPSGLSSSHLNLTSTSANGNNNEISKKNDFYVTTNVCEQIKLRVSILKLNR